MASLGLPFEFTLPGLYKSHYETWSSYAVQINEYHARLYRQWADNWMLNAPNLVATGNALPPVIQPPERMIVTEVIGKDADVTFGPALVCDPDPRIAAFLAPPTPVADKPPIVGVERPSEPGTYFIFVGRDYDTTAVGTTIMDPVHGKLLRSEKAGLFGGAIEYWQKV